MAQPALVAPVAAAEALVMRRWRSAGAVAIVAGVVAFVAWDWWRYPVLDAQLGYRPAVRCLP